MSSSSSSLYDATLAGLDFRTLLPGLWGLGTDEDEVSDTETVKGSGTASASRKVGAKKRSAALAADELIALAPRPRADADLRATVDVALGQGMARGKKRGNAVKTSKVRLPSKRARGHVRRLLRHDDARCREYIILTLLPGIDQGDSAQGEAGQRRAWAPTCWRHRSVDESSTLSRPAGGGPCSRADRVSFSLLQ